MNVNPVVVIDVVGLTPDLLAHMPRLAALGEAGFQAPLAMRWISMSLTCR